MVTLPATLFDLVREQRVVLFLGSGASHGAKHPRGKPIPKGAELRDKICDKFLGGELKEKSLSAVAEIAAHETSLAELQRFVADIFVEFYPAAYHLAIPTFRWRS